MKPLCFCTNHSYQEEKTIPGKDQTQRAGGYPLAKNPWNDFGKNRLESDYMNLNNL